MGLKVRATDLGKKHRESVMPLGSHEKSQVSSRTLSPRLFDITNWISQEAKRAIRLHSGDIGCFSVTFSGLVLDDSNILIRDLTHFIPIINRILS